MALDDLMKRFVLGNVLTFSKGDIELMHVRFVMIPNDIWGKFISNTQDRPEYARRLYALLRENGASISHDDIAKRFGFNFHDAEKWFVDMIKMMGLGIDVLEADQASRHAILHVSNSPTAIYLKGKVSRPCDHYLRALFSSGGSVAFKAAVHCIETECEANGAKQCVFILDELDRLKGRYPDLVREQIGEEYMNLKLHLRYDFATGTSVRG